TAETLVAPVELLPGSSVPPSSVGTDDGTPAAAWPALRPIQDSLDDIEATLAGVGPFDAQQLMDWQLLLDELRCDLDELSGDAEIDDGAWQDTSTRMGELERQIRSLQEVEVSA